MHGTIASGWRKIVFFWNSKASFHRLLLKFASIFRPKNITECGYCEYIPFPITSPSRPFVYVSWFVSLNKVYVIKLLRYFIESQVSSWLIFSAWLVSFNKKDLRLLLSVVWRSTENHKRACNHMQTFVRLSLFRTTFVTTQLDSYFLWCT